MTPGRQSKVSSPAGGSARSSMTGAPDPAGLLSIAGLLLILLLD